MTIEVNHLCKVFGSTAAIQDVSFAIEAGEIMGFLGPNGAGKTTTMRILAGYLPATTGTAKVAGYDVSNQSMAVRQRIGYLPESPPLYPDMTVEGFLFFVSKIKGVPAGERAAKVSSSIRRCQIEDKRKVLIRKLSKGYRQRVGIAQALVHNPPVIILDEPTVGLDPRQIIEVRNLVKSLAGDHTVILSTHILPEVSQTCDRVTIINRGQVVATDSPNSLMAQLSEGAGYQVEVEGEGNAIPTLLGELPGVERVESHSHPERSNRCLVRIATAPHTEPGREIAAAVVNAGFGLCELRRTRPTLEDVFLELTTEEIIESE